MKKIVIKKLIWDEWNVTHIAEHDVAPSEVEEVCQGTVKAYESYDGRYEVIEQTKKGRILMVILDPEPQEGEYYIVTAHTANKKDRIIYLKEKGGEKAA